MEEITLTIHPFLMGTDKESAIKVLEEASEVRAAWSEYFREEMDSLQQSYPSQDIRLNVEEGLSDYIDALRETLADEIADVIQAACNLAARYYIDLPAAMKRCEQRNRARGRYEQAEAPKVPEMSDGAKKILNRMMTASDFRRYIFDLENPE